MLFSMIETQLTTSLAQKCWIYFADPSLSNSGSWPNCLAKQMTGEQRTGLVQLQKIFPLDHPRLSPHGRILAFCHAGLVLRGADARHVGPRRHAGCLAVIAELQRPHQYERIPAGVTGQAAKRGS